MALKNKYRLNVIRPMTSDIAFESCPSITPLDANLLRIFFAPNLGSLPVFLRVLEIALPLLFNQFLRVSHAPSSVIFEVAISVLSPPLAHEQCCTAAFLF